MEQGTGRAAFRWTFDGAQFDEATWTLQVRGAEIEIERRPLEVLSCLLHNAGEVVTKDELLEAAWSGRVVVEGALTNAIGKLRKALGDEDQRVIATVARVGYRLQGKVERKAIARGAIATMLKAGDAVPRRPNWRLQRPLDQGESGEVWLGEHAKTHETRVFKFSFDGRRLHALKREATISRLLHDSLGDRADFVRVNDWDFDDAPYFIESEFGGPNLEAWAQSHGGMQSIPLEQRVAWLAEVADAVAAAHEVGVLHKDLKPANVLVRGEPGDWHPRLVDFGSGRVLDPERLEAFRITRLGLTQTQGVDSDSLTGTPLYLAPELLAGQVPTVRSDIYALGVILYQLCVGDLRRPMSPGWENEIGDAMLREDIASAANGNPNLRFDSVRDLALRLRTREERARQHDLDATTHARAEAAERALAASRARRPWLIGALAIFAVGFAASAFLYVRAQHAATAAEQARAREQKEARITKEMNDFLNKDVLGQADVNNSGKGTLSLLDAIHASAGRIDKAFPQDPEVAAGLHETIGVALRNREDVDGAETEYSKGAELYAKALGPSATKTLNLRMRLIATRLVDDRYINHDFKPELEELDRLVRAGDDKNSERVSLFYSRNSLWTIYYADHLGQFALALPYAKANYERARSDPNANEQRDAFARENYAFQLIQLKHFSEADKLLIESIEKYTKEKGATHPYTMDFRHRYVMSLISQRRFTEAKPLATTLYEDRLKTLGDKSLDTIDALSNVAAIKYELGEWQEAATDYRRMLEMYSTQSEGWEFAVLNIRRLWALSVAHLGRVDAALKEIRDVRKAAMQHYAKSEEIMTFLSYSEALIDLQGEKWRDAAALLAPITQDVVLSHSMYLAGDEGLAMLNFAKARAAFGQHDVARASTLIDSAVAGLQKVDPPDFLPVREAIEFKKNVDAAKVAIVAARPS